MKSQSLRDPTFLYLCKMQLKHCFSHPKTLLHQNPRDFLYICKYLTVTTIFAFNSNHQASI